MTHKTSAGAQNTQTVMYNNGLISGKHFICIFNIFGIPADV